MFVLYKYLRFWYLFILSLLVALTVAYLYILHATPVYLISGTLLIKTNQKDSELTENAAFSDLNTFKTSKNFDNEIEVLKSYKLIRKVLSELPVHISYYIEEPYKQREIYGNNVPIKINLEDFDTTTYHSGFIISFKDEYNYYLEEGEQTYIYRYGEKVKRPYGTFAIAISDTHFEPVESLRRNKIRVVFEHISILAQYYSNWLYVEPVNTNASVLEISITDPIPERGKAVIDKLMEEYREDALQGKNQIAFSTIALIDSRLENLSTELNNIESEVEQYKRSNQITDVASQSKVFVEESSKYQSQMAEWTIQIDVLETIERYLRTNNDGKNKLVPSTLSIQDPTLQELISKFNALQLERERMLRTTESMNPLVQNIEEQIRVLQTNILENIKNIKDGLVVTRRNLQGKSEIYNSKINSVPIVERELEEIVRQKDIKQLLYKYLLEKREESALALASTSSSSQVLRPAVVEERPIRPKKQTIFFLSILVGIGIPLAFVYFKVNYNVQVQQRADVEKATSTPVLGEISFNDTKEAVVVTESSRSSTAELFRLVRSNLQFVAQEKNRKVILITSSLSGEGKTFFSLNLGASLALTGKKVALIDFDLRKPSILTNLGLKCDYGITDFLTSEHVGVDKIISISGNTPNLCIIGSGSIPLSPAELMLSNKVEVLFKELKKTFDYILVDTAPVGQVADAFNLSRYIDITLYLVRYNYTPKSEIEVINDIYVNRRFNQPMIVLNGAKKFNSYKYGYTYGYGYGKKGNEQAFVQSH